MKNQAGTGISVLMSVCAQDHPDFLRASLRSLADQDRSPDEVLLVEDGPLPATLSSVINEFRLVMPLKTVCLRENSGLGAALSEGLGHCSHGLVARMDADDVSLPSRLGRQAREFDLQPELDVLGSFATEFDENSVPGRLRTMPKSHTEILASMWANPIIHSTVMFRKERILGVGGYDPRLRRRQDYELWFRCAEKGLRFANLPEPLLLYRFNEASHRRQPARLAFEQARIGHRGAARQGMPYWKRLACYIPVFRSLFPLRLQHWLYRRLRQFDPRQNVK